MTVRELIAELQKLDPDQHVKVLGFPISIEQWDTGGVLIDVTAIRARAGDVIEISGEG